MRKATVAALNLFAVLSLVLTYPLPLHLANAVEDRQDALLNVWITAWDGHQLLADPLHLFDANIFYPYSRTLAYSELLLGNALLALPLTAATHNPVLGYNVALLLSFFLTGLGTYLLVLKLTRSPGAGLVSGTILAFCSYRMTNLAQAQLLTTQWLPFTLLAWVHLLHRPRPRHAVAFCLFFCLQALSSFYYGLLLALALAGFTFLALAWTLYCLLFRGLVPRGRIADSRAPGPVPGAALRPPAGWPGTLGFLLSRFAPLLLAACCSLLILLPFTLPYFEVQGELGFERSLADSEPFSASLGQYLMVPPGSVLHGRWLPSDDTPLAGGYPADALFPGLAALALGLWGTVRGRGRMRWAFVLLLLAAALLSLGPRLYLAPGRPAGLDLTLPYAWLYAVVPGFKALRAPGRFAALVMLALAVLAGYGVASFKWQMASKSELATRNLQLATSRRTYRAIIACSLALVIAESLVWPAARAEPVAVGSEVPAVYRWLADQGQRAGDNAPGTVLELPMAFTAGGPQLEYQYLSTYHWSTTPDGYSGFIPPPHGQIVYEMERFPSERSLSLLQALDVRYVIVHTGRYPAGRQAELQTALAHSQDLALVQAFGPDQVYRLQPRAFSPADLAVQLYLPPRAVAGRPYTAYVIAINPGVRSYALRPTAALAPVATWQTGPEQVADSGEAAAGVAELPLVTSPGGGAAVIPLALTAPATPGTWQLTVAQADSPWGEPLGYWSGSGSVQVGDQGDDAFPVPARLESWSLPPTARPGGSLPVSLTWRALGKIDAYYSVYVKLLDAGGNAVAGWDGQPGNGAAPTLLWVPGERVDDTVTLAVPAGTPAGAYTVEVGLYRAADLARCLTFDAQGALLDRVLLGSVQVEP